MRLRKALWLLFVVAMHLLACGAHNSGPGPGIFPRRRSSNDGIMQSRAVDTRVQFEILEGEPRGTIVGYIPTKPGFTYRFNEPPREFTLDSVTGEIKTNAVLDREAITNDRYDLVILSSQPTYPIEVRIIVQDINDNAPEFPEPSIAVSFSESAAQGTRLLLDAATDRDSGTNKVTDDYRIVDGNHDDKFRLAVTTNPSGDVSYLHLETTGKLDRETRGSYVLNISARDGGSPPKNGYLQVNVTILDVNDNPPIFDHSDYIVSLNESVVPGTPVLQVMASDNDLGDNSKITYYLSDTETQFTVDPETGVITTTELLSCPQQNCPTFTTKPGSCPKSCVFTVFARDHGSPRQDGRTYVTVNLVDTNDHAPQIRFQYFPPTGTYATVDENAVNGSVVAAVSVEDMDEGLNGETSLKIISGNDLGHFRLDKTPSFDIVRVNGVLDREEIGKYNLTVVASDKGTPSRTATAYLIIHVNDVNDHEPVFEKSEYSAILSELAPSGTFVASITATDEDTGVNAQIYYDFVSGNNKQWFSIDSVSGLITTKAPLDREVQGSIELSISARDGGPNPKWAYTHLKVTILDENDEKPKFSQPHINISLSESTQPHTLVAMLTASDLDQGTNGSVSYSLHSSVEQNYPNMFTLDSLTGQLTIKSKLDRETIADYEIRVIAKDQGLPQQSSTATVFLHVDDINDNSPEFYPKRYFVALSDDTAIGTSIIKVHATDRDDGDNAIITYKLESGGDGFFVVDNWTGVMSLRSSLRSSQKSLFKLTVSAKDRGDRRTERDAIVEIVRESKLEELEFDAHGNYEFSIYEDFGSENSKIGREVGKTKVTTSSSAVEYAIVYGDPNGNFKIDEQTGIIVTAKPIDREESMIYTLTVVARAELAYGNVSVIINILDLNDNAPIFTRDKDEIYIPENAAVGKEIYLARARDKDAGINSRITYSLTYNPQEQFRISESSGVLYLNRPIRVDPGTVMHLEITAMDGGEPHLMSKNNVIITIEDVNDHTCVFDHTSYETSLLESTHVNTRFFALSASDADLGANGRISYKIVDGNSENKFGIFPDGYLFVKSRLDREERDYYSLTISCSDGGNPQRSTEVPVVIHVIDVNDNAPQFTNATFTFNIAENEPVDSFVGKLTATDRDIGRNAELIFMLSNVQNDFMVDPRNGFIKTLHEFDREALVQQTGQNFITLEATVTDNGAVRLKDKVKVKIFINDVNDHAPQFLRAPYKVQVSEGSTIGSQLIRVYTFDADEGLNGDVFYQISDGNDGGKFAIDESTGQLTLVKSLDRETMSIYKLTIVAHDAAKIDRLSSSTTITIEVLDENDCSPEFVQTDTNIKVIETTPVGTELIKFRATDSDLGINSQLTYSIAAGNRRDTFHIDPISGSLYLHKLLDYEDTQSYSLNITASDGGNPRLSTTIMFVVTVFDYNDNAPTFPNTAIVRQIREGIPINTPIVTITAEDPDSGLNGKVTYAIQSQDPTFGQRHFGINATSGVIFTMRQIDRESVDTFRLIVVATDQAEVPSQRLSAEKLVTVIVEDINDCEPIFVSMNAAVLPLKDIRVEPGRDGYPIMNVFARDADSSSNGLVTYEMVSGNSDLFKLHRSTGVISLKKTINNNPEARYQLAVKATDEAVQSERKSSDAYITIISSSSASGGPVFEQKDLSGSVFENEPAGTSILTVSAHLSSNGAGQEIEYYVTNVTGNGKQVDRLFDIDTKLGILSTAIELDRENGIETYVIEVYAIVIGGIPRTSSTKVKVTVLDKNDESPTFRDLPLSYMVSEDLGNGQIIATIKATDPDTIGKLEYSLISGDDGKFTLDKHQGVLKLRDTLDRETKDLYKLVIRVTDSVQYTETTISIQVTDSNDNPPVFTEPAYSFDIPENAPRGYQVGLISATDADLGANSMLTYTVISDWANDVFSLNPQTGVFTLTARLDYEEVQHYILVVQAQDNGHPSLSSTLTVYCNVIDLNDNAPVFDPMSYSNEIYENVPIGTEVVTVSATDIDSGDNGRIEYSITAGNDDDFEIVSNGTIYTKRMLDRETKSTYNLVVTARDCAKDVDKRLSSTVQVTVILKDVNDVKPVFITPNETSVSENIPINTVMMAIKAIDRDEGRNGYVEYMLETNSSSIPFTLGSVDGLLRVSGRLDREIKANYELTVTARDRGEPPKSTQSKILVKVLDENDNSPVFDPKHYSASIAENASIGASVLQVSATDIDEGANGRVRFSIASGDDNRDFSISEDTGVVRVAKNLNYERKSRYVLTVRAEDCASDVGSGETRFDTAELIITITDINDCFPTFLDSPYLAYVMENVIPNGGYVISVKAYDADTPPFNNQVRYFLKEGDADLFRINASTGEISLLRALDREQQAEYTLTLVAMDTGSPPLTGTGTVRVIVQDMNDHSPEFERQSYRATVSENLPAGTKVLTPIARDKDAGLNAKIRFSLLGDKVERFHINHDTGEITTAIMLDREDTAVYHFTLMAQDSSATEPRAAAVNFTITVDDMNDNTPSFEQAAFTVNIPDRIKTGQFVFGAKATDLDDGINSKILYSIGGKDASKFNININTGVIKAAEELSLIGHSNDRIFNIDINAIDQGHEPKSAKCELTIELRPAHLFPTFSYSSETQFILSEDVPEGKLVTKIQASSPKKGSIGNIKYAIAGGNINNALKIDRTNGDVTIGPGRLDYEISQQYEVWIEASDSDNPSLRSVMKLTINVTDANDNGPIMEKMIYSAEVLEEEPPPQMVARIRATDADSDENGQVSYRLVNDFESAFEIDSDTGEIFTNLRLDREDIASYELTVEAVDQGMPQMTGSATVLITVLDKNDNPPRFTRLFSVNVTENAEIGSFVIKVTSSDLDINENANATYNFTENPGNKFAIDPISGNVTVAGRLDREQQDEYLLKVVAVDGAWRQETPLTITIQDLNDNAPEFEHSYYSFNLPELQKNVAFVGQVTATDRDKQGPNSIISYSLQHPSDLFTIDPASGEIFSKRTIHYKHSQMESSPENMYAMTVLATDNGKPPMYSECLVNINIVDANNNPPKFEKRDYLSPVPEDAKEGQRVVQVVAKDTLDFGVNAEIEYVITGGNGSNNFVINKNDGWISVNKPLNVGPSSVYQLSIRAVDKGVPPQYDDVTVTIVVAGENRFSPVFTALSYQVIVPENEPIGSTILVVSASDNDDGPNGMIRYTISGGNERKEFAVDPLSGSVTILQSLDYDIIQEYHLNITARDLGFKPRSVVAMLRVTLTDINDQKPEFNQTEYHAYIPENSPAKSFVYKAQATDKDSPKNAIIQYTITSGSGKEFFTIDPQTGVIYSKVTFDYEEQNQYQIIITASNPDSTMFSTTKVTIHITGVNEFYPRFVQPVFHFDVSESAEVGTSIGSIQATDKDSGDDGKVYYLLVGSSNDKGFSINAETGIMYVSRNLDRETQSRVVLTVMAKNFGGIRGNDTDEAQVIISIQDGNDPPEFQLNLYEANVSEDANIGTKVVAVKAVDKDVRPQNNQFSYSIIGGNVDQAFKIDPQSGQVETARKLDRETTPTYSIIVGAIDTGMPPQTGTTMVKINLSDVNDNGPTFDDNNLIGYVSENEPVGTSVLTLSAKDPDLPPNGAPFTYYLIGGKHKALVNIEKHSGLIKTTRSIDREVTPQLEIMIEVEDNGKPKMRSQHKVIINVLDQNDSPSMARVAHVMVYTFNGKIQTGKIADVHPNDPDSSGDYKCKLISAVKGGALSIPNACDLHITPSIKYTGYSLSISGNDGIHSDVISTISVDFLNFDNNTVANSITIRVENMTAANFLANFYRSFQDIVKASMETGDDISVYSIRENQDGVEITIASKFSAGYSYRSPSYIVERVQKKREAFVQLLQNRNLIMPYSPCNANNTCANAGICSEKINVQDEVRIIDSQNLVFTSPLVSHDFNCKCSDGFTGEKCDKRQDPCAPNPCQAGGQCRRQGYDFQCTCPPNREGKLCQLERGDACSSNPCKSGGSCRESPDGSSFFCLCRPGYRGNQCETIADSCRPNPCLYGGLCVSLKPGYKCSCTDGRYGRHCERATYGFQELSFMQFPALDAATNDISIVFATTKPDALLIYNYGVQSGGRSDFVAMEIVGGKAVFSYGGARTAITSIVVGGSNAADSLSNGRWHKVTATRNGRVMSLSVAKCTDNGDVCDECRPGDTTCYSDEVGPTGTLNFNKHPLLIGGLSSADPILERPGQIHSDDLIGCVHSVSVNGRALNLSNPIKATGVTSTCNRNNNGGPCSQGHPDDPALSLCGAFDGCMDRWHTAMCKCGGDLLSPDCYTSIDPISLVDGGFIEYKISEKHKRMQLLENIYSGMTNWNLDLGRQKRFSIKTDNISSLAQVDDPPKSMSVKFRTVKSDGLLIYAATNKHYTSIELRDGKLVYISKQNTQVNMTSSRGAYLSDGKWHNLTLFSHNRIVQMLVDGKLYGEELDSTGVHDFLDPYLTVLSVGGVRRELVFPQDTTIPSFEGCIANFTINNEIQPFNGSGSIYKEVLQRGKVFLGCHPLTGLASVQVTDPLSIGITLVIVFFVILLVAILASFVVFRIRKQQKEKHGAGALHSKQNGNSTLLGGSGLVSGSGNMDMSRGIHVGDLSGVGFHSDASHGTHHLVAAELISKKYKEREINSAEPQRPQRPDIIEREVVSKSPPPLREVMSNHTHDHLANIDNGSEFPEHYDLENASSIAPSDIDIVYHYKGYREAGGVRHQKYNQKYKATPPPNSYTHHKHQSSAAQHHRHSPHHVGPYAPRVPQTSQPPTATPRPPHQSTPLARLSPSSEMSSQHPRILTLHDISGKPLQSALLATTSSSGGVGKDVLHSNSERSLNSPVMSQLSGQSSSTSRKTPGMPPKTPNVSNVPMGLTAEEIERLNSRPRTSSLVSTLDAVSSSSEAPRVPGQHMNHMHHSPVVDNHSSTSSDESGNDSFTCSEIEYDNNSINGDIRPKRDDERNGNESGNASTSSKPHIPPPSYDGFDSSFRGSLSTLVASDDDISTHMVGGMYRQPNAASPSATTLGWDYLLNWGPNFESLMGVFKDIAELPDNVNGARAIPSSLRIPASVQNPSEEYV
ncbi:hypothetical protein PVAND_005341 [Polypedilum vanderplanki]|uniref:Protocadherin-16 n=1 Tax=Polypedilum vanderplanki TaxID=319348 RepID=A0A9J6C0Q8_POLVA|nr:hypothetical protein PVAND_005341 [Polypedilum vanderplanki]